MKTDLIVILILWCAVPWLFCVANNVAICPKCEGKVCDNPPKCICLQNSTQPGRIQCAMVTLVNETDGNGDSTVVANCVFYLQTDTNDTACSLLAQAGKKVKSCKLSNPEVRDDSHIKDCIYPNSTSPSTSTTSTQQTTTTETTATTIIVTSSDTTPTSSITSSTTTTTASTASHITTNTTTSRIPTSSSAPESSTSTVTTRTTSRTTTRSTKRPTRWTQLPIFGDQSKQHHATRWPPIRDSAQPAFSPILFIFTIISNVVIRINQVL